MRSELPAGMGVPGRWFSDMACDPRRPGTVHDLITLQACHKCALRSLGLTELLDIQGSLCLTLIR